MARRPPADRGRVGVRGARTGVAGLPVGRRRSTSTAANVIDSVAARSRSGAIPTGVSWVGAHDMAGNAMEWVADWLAADLLREAARRRTRPGPATGAIKVEKGGWWGSNEFVARLGLPALRGSADLRRQAHRLPGRLAVTETPERIVVAMGGGGFSMEPDNPRLDDFILSRARAAGADLLRADGERRLGELHRAVLPRVRGQACVPTDLTLCGGPLERQPKATDELAAFVAAQDVIYVGGGNTANLLALWRAHGLDRILRDAWTAGAVLCGVSAGMICWFSAGVTDSYGALAPLPDGLGLLAGSACPHYDGEAARRPRYHALVASGFPAGYAADDGAALCFTGDALTEVVASRPDAAAYRVELRDRTGRAIETVLPTRYLG